MDRRDFLKLSAGASVMLTAGSSLALLTGCGRNDGPAHGYRHLRSQDVTLLRPLARVLLAPALAAADATADQALLAFDDLLDGGMPGTRGAVFELLDLLQLAPGRWYLTGTWKHFAEQTEEQLSATLDHWSRSQSELPRAAFRGLTQPFHMAWYVKPDAARTTGYPGPPNKIIG